MHEQVHLAEKTRFPPFPPSNSPYTPRNRPCKIGAVAPRNILRFYLKVCVLREPSEGDCGCCCCYVQIMCQEAARTPRFRPRTSVVPSHGRSYPKPRRLKSFGKKKTLALTLFLDSCLFPPAAWAVCRARNRLHIQGLLVSGLV